MVKRKGIGKKIRFEVFKRDSFRCQYCGGTAPDVILVIDHIKPVKEGGTNEIMNLITSCQDCNSGKGARLLDDDSVIKKQRKQLEELNERRDQLEMMMNWREGLKDIQNREYEIIKEKVDELTEGLIFITKNGEAKIRSSLRRHGLIEMLESIEIAADKVFEYDKNDALEISSARSFVNMALRICKTREYIREKPYLKELFYIRGILRNRFHYIDLSAALKMLEEAHILGVSNEQLRDYALKCKDWKEFCRVIEEIIGVDEGGDFS